MWQTLDGHQSLPTSSISRQSPPSIGAAVEDEFDKLRSSAVRKFENHSHPLVQSAPDSETRRVYDLRVAYAH